ncbi:MAG: hypothetical protein OEV66_01945 [Spirochaetia bacterium]|nr:hypothetical protein [Spirochaetia bacterium]
MVQIKLQGSNNMARRLANKGKRSIPKVTELGKRNYANRQEKITEYQKRITDEDYIEYAIDKIAAELTHFLLK